MVIGLLRDQVTFAAGFWYLILYNVILIIPLALVLWFSADKAVVDKLQEWKRDNLMRVRLVAGIAMMVLGALILIV